MVALSDGVVMLNAVSRSWPLGRRFRIYLAYALSGAALGTWLSFFLLFGTYYLSRPKLPDVARGLIYSLSNHGGRAYLSSVDTTALSLAMVAAFTAFCLGFLVVPKDLRTSADRQAGWAVRWGATHDAELAQYWGPKVVTGVSVIIGAALIWFFGADLAAALVAHGVILHWT